MIENKKQQKKKKKKLHNHTNQTENSIENHQKTRLRIRQHRFINDVFTHLMPSRSRGAEPLAPTLAQQLYLVMLRPTGSSSALHQRETIKRNILFTYKFVLQRLLLNSQVGLDFQTWRTFNRDRTAKSHSKMNTGGQQKTPRSTAKRFLSATIGAHVMSGICAAAWCCLSSSCCQ